MQGLSFRGRPPVQIADSVLDVVRLENPYAAQIMDRTVPIDLDFARAIIGQSIFTWVGRNPRPALDEDGNFRGTDLDLLSFLMPLAARRAVIELPRYRNFRPATRREGERFVGGGSRFGSLVGLVSHQDVLSMNARIFDSTIVRRDPETEIETVGGFRSFMLVSPRAEWHEGWERIIFDPTAAENAFLREQELLVDNAVSFTNAVHPNRWSSVFGAPYLLLKMLIERARDEASFYRTEVDRLKELGIYPSTARSYPPSVSSPKVQKVKVETLEVVLDIPEFHGEYTPATSDVAGADMAYERQKLLTRKVQSQAQFVVRSDELAYFLHGNARVASWMPGRGWKTDFRVPRGRVDWNQMTLSNTVGLRWRRKMLTQDAAVSFEQTED